MKNEINYYYNIYPEKITKCENNYYFYIGEIKYFLLYYTKTIRELELTITMINEYVKRNINIDEIILNRDNSYVSSIDGNNYILLRLSNIKLESLVEINKFDTILKTNKKDELGYNDWDILWGKKIDNYEIKIANIINKNKLIASSFDYYIGLAENAISYVKDTLTLGGNDTLVIEHKRINDCGSNILNPFNLVVDYEARDIGEYIKSKFFNDIFSFKELEDLMESKYFSTFSLRMIFARLLYPTYYFDLVDRALKNENVDNELSNVISKINDYELFLIEVHDYLSEFSMIPKIDWLYRKKD